MVIRGNTRSKREFLRGSIPLLALLCLAMGMFLPVLSTFAQSNQPLVVVGRIDGTITPVMARYVGRGESSGIEMDQKVVTLYELRKGKVVTMRDYPTRAEALEAAGMSEY